MQPRKPFCLDAVPPEEHNKRDVHLCTASHFMRRDIMERLQRSLGYSLTLCRCQQQFALMGEAVLNNKMMKRTWWVERTRKAKSAFVRRFLEFNPGIHAYSKQMIGVLFSLLIKVQPSVVLPASNSQPQCPLYVNCCRENTHFRMLLLQHSVRRAIHLTCKLNPSALPAR